MLKKMLYTHTHTHTNVQTTTCTRLFYHEISKQVWKIIFQAFGNDEEFLD